MDAEPDTRTMILERARELFEHKGYAAVSVREICAACGVTKPTLYYYFADKETLYAAVLLRRLRGYRELLVPTREGEPVRVRLERLARHIFSRMTTNVDVMMRDMENITNPAHHAELRAAFASELYGPIHAAMAEGVAAGALRPANPSFYAKLFLGVVNAFISAPRLPGGQSSITWVGVPADPAERAAAVLDVLCAGLEPRADQSDRQGA